VASMSDSSFGKLRGMLGGRSGGSNAVVNATKDEMQQAIRLLRDYENSGLGWFWSTNAEGKVDYISECVAQKLGKPREELAGQQFHTLFILDHGEDDRVERTLPLILSGHKTFSELPVRTASDDEEVWWAISGRPQFTVEGTFTGYYGNGVDITASRRSQKDASRLAMYDSLTGLSNRHRMGQRLTAILTAYKAAKRNCALMMIDLDRFKQVNDTLGHPAGDELLKQVAQRVQRIVPETGELGRLGGDEFQVILPDMEDRGQLGDLAKKLIDIVSQPYSIEGSRCVIGASVGIAIAPFDGIDNEELVRSADLALYAAKGGGRGQFRFYSSDLHAEAERRRQIEEDLRDALAKDQIWLAYQPVVEANSNKVVGFEALLRWTHPELGNVPPTLFIPIAEETNLIGPLGDWALKQACADAVQWPGNVRIAVNVSPIQFGNLDFPTAVTQALSNSGLAPGRLELELTESVFLNEGDATDHMFNTLKMLGVRFALDDFGTGYSSLGYLKRAPFDKIKIDKTFIDGVTEEGSRNVAIIKSIVSLAEGLNMETTAEGIEAHDELAKMNELGVKLIQGFIYARPLGFEEVSEALSSGEWILEPDGPSKYRNDRMTVFRKIGLIHEDHRYEVMMRNISRTGCLIEGLLDLPLGAEFVADFGEGQLVVAHVRRSSGPMAGLEFETSLVDDGAGGLCTRHRVSPYVLAAAGMPLGALPAGHYPLGPGGTMGGMAGGLAGGLAGFSMPKFSQINESARKSVRKEG
jgi:diguanylate cyclase (GGDEF)-like protein/PAS domain S-box-containing protein